MTKNTRASIDDVGSLIAWLIEQAIQAADADQPRDAGMLTWAAQVIGECVDEDAPDPPAAPDDKEPASVVGEPSDEELLGLDQLEEAWNAQADAANDWDELGLDEIIVWAQRQALARWGHQPAFPAEGEVAELMEWLRHGCQSGDLSPYWRVQQRLNRAAALLEQRHPEPVPVSERLPGPEDCNEQGMCWLIGPRLPTWDLNYPPKTTSSTMWTHWLRATDLPLPAGEGEQ